MKLFLADNSLRPAYGGPAHSVSQLATALAEAGVRVGLWAADQSAAATTLLSADSPVQRLMGSPRKALNSFGIVDVLHDNGIWLSHNHRLAQLSAERGIPRVVSTRGMLEPSAMYHGRLKKRVAWLLYQRRDLVRAHWHHTTADGEASNLRRLKLGVPVRVIANGVDVRQGGLAPGMREARKRNARQRTALFLGPIYAVKGLPWLIEAWARVRPNGWSLRIAGPDDAGHRAEMESAVLAAGLGEIISSSDRSRVKRSALHCSTRIFWCCRRTPKAPAR